MCMPHRESGMLRTGRIQRTQWPAEGAVKAATFRHTSDAGDIMCISKVHGCPVDRMP